LVRIRLKLVNCIVIIRTKLALRLRFDQHLLPYAVYLITSNGWNLFKYFYLSNNVVVHGNHTVFCHDPG